MHASWESLLSEVEAVNQRVDSRVDVLLRVGARRLALVLFSEVSRKMPV